MHSPRYCKCHTRLIAPNFADERALERDNGQNDEMARPTVLKKVKPPINLNSTTSGHVQPTRNKNGEVDKDYAPPKRLRALSESPIPSFDVDSDGHEMVPKPPAVRASLVSI
jgi:hypothetical protein